MDPVMLKRLEKFLVMFNKYPQHGNFSILSHDEAGLGDDADLETSDIIIYYDFSNDECADNDEKREFADWIFGHENQNVLETITLYMRSHGYQFFYEQDGSGNGLYYGVMQFRKV